VPDTQRSVKALTLLEKKVDKCNIRKNIEIIRLYNPNSDIGGCVSVCMNKKIYGCKLSAYIAKTEIQMDNYPSICQIGRDRWTVIRLNSKQGNMGGCCPSTYS
jgi:hypothetical protein